MCSWLSVACHAQAEELATSLLSNGQITASALPEYAANLARFTSLANDYAFPGWLTTSADFKDHFPRLKGEEDTVGPSLFHVEAPALTPPRDRHHREAET